MKKIINLVLVAFALLIGLPTEADMKTITIHTLTGDEANYDTSEKRLGVMVIERIAIFTIERPYLENPDAPPGVINPGIPNLSAVPLGEYDLVLRKSPKHGVQWHFYNPDLHVFLEETNRKYGWQRYSTMFHPANFAHEVAGCCGPGMGLHDFPHGLGVRSSRGALAVINRYLSGQTQARLIID